MVRLVDSTDPSVKNDPATKKTMLGTLRAAFQEPTRPVRNDKDYPPK